MEIIVQPPAKVVIVDGITQRVEATYPQGVALMRWAEGQGVIQYSDGREPVKTDNQALFKPWLDLYRSSQKLEKQRQEAAEKEAKREAEERLKAQPPMVQLLSDPDFPSDRQILFALLEAVVLKKPARANSMRKLIEDLKEKYQVE